MAEGVRRSEGREMQTGSRVGRRVAWRVCSKSFCASPTVGRTSSFADEAIGRMYGEPFRGKQGTGHEQPQA